MPKTVLNFSLESTDESITPRAGSIILGEYLHAIGLPELIERHLPQPRSAKGYSPSFFVQPRICSRVCVRWADARSAGVFDQNAGAPGRCVEALGGSPMSPMIGADHVKSNAYSGFNLCC